MLAPPLPFRRVGALGAALAFAVSIAGCGSATQASGSGSDLAITQVCDREKTAASRLTAPSGTAAARIYVSERLGTLAPDLHVLATSSPGGKIRSAYQQAVALLSQEQSQIVTLIAQAPPGNLAASSMSIATITRTGSQDDTRWRAAGVPACTGMLSISPAVLRAAHQSVAPTVTTRTKPGQTHATSSHEPTTATRRSTAAGRSTATTSVRPTRRAESTRKARSAG